MSTGLIITLVICTTLIVLTIANNSHKVKMAEIQLKRDGNPFIPKTQNNNDGGSKHE
jgi:hypothetical protein